MILRIGRTLAYDLVQRFETSGGREGLPAVRVGSCWRVPREVVLQIVLGSRTVGTLVSQLAVEVEGNTRAVSRRALSCRRLRRLAPGGSSEQLFLLPPSD